MILSFKRFNIILKHTAPVVLVYLIYFFTMEFYIYPYDNYLSVRTKLKKQYNSLKIPNEVDYLVLGDSTALYSIQPRLLTPASYSAATLATSAMKTFEELLSLGDIKISKGIILTQTFTEAHYDEDLWKILIPAKIINLDQLYLLMCNKNKSDCNNIEKINLSIKYFTSKLHLSMYSFQTLKGFLKNIIPNEFRISDDLYFKILVENNGSYSSPSSIKIRTYDFLAPYNQLFKHKQSKPPKIEISYIYDIINYAAKRKLNVFYVITPLASNFMNSSADKYDEGLEEVLKNIKASNFIIVNGRKFQKDLFRSDFTDYSHLNEEGAKKFTLYLSQLLNSSPAPQQN